ncbi:hypothetical protein ACH42_14235 [Endozoicomonas sp. (ex Bugula neritina AB1)]|nr:hypothetical protein ACH42_14235 [Endozoicomonas sp. (ex Bugula neritina AB1)]
MNGKRLIRRGILILSLVSVSLVQAENIAREDNQPTPQQWLERMAKSSRELTYQGDLVYQQGGLLETLNIAHTVDSEGKEQERIIYLDGAPREMVRRDQQLVFSNYGRVDTRFEHGALMPMLGKFSQGNSILDYELKIVGLDRVAGRESLLLMVIPKDRFRYGYQLWLDRASGLLIKSMMINDSGQIMERMQFTHLNVGGSLSKETLSALNKKQGGTDRVVPMEHSDVNEKSTLGWETGWVPQGFDLKSRSKRPSPISNQQVDALNFSDGIASFSVFVEPDETRVLSQASENIGALAAVSKVYRDGDKYFHVTVVGEIPLSAAERIAVSVRPVKSDS